MSEQDIGRRMAEEEELRYFIDAYSRATGRRMIVLSKKERPDFICRIEDEDPVGVELTKLMRSPNEASWQRNVESREFRDSSEAYLAALEEASRKSRKMQDGNWELPERTILVLQDVDCPLRELYREFRTHPSLQDFRYFGFKEIWIADYSEVQVYGDIELMGVFPRNIRRYYRTDRGKPYG